MVASNKLIYDETSPSGLRWAENIYSGRYYKILEVAAGDVAGCINGSGYYQTRINGILTSNHRLIWEMFNAKIKCGEYIDHINGNQLDNKLSNLRLVTRELNSRNCKLRKDSTSGEAGVNRLVNTYSSGSQTEYWCAVWMENGRQKKKSFRIDVYGEQGAKDLAIAYRRAKLAELNASGAGYTDRHGK